MRVSNFPIVQFFFYFLFRRPNRKWRERGRDLLAEKLVSEIENAVDDSEEHAVRVSLAHAFLFSCVCFVLILCMAATIT